MSITAQDPSIQSSRRSGAILQGAFAPTTPATAQPASSIVDPNTAGVSAQDDSVIPNAPAAQMDILNQVLDDVEAFGVDQQQAAAAAAQQLPRSFKERPAGTQNAVESTSVDFGSGIQTVESEKNPEIPTEVESFLQRVEDHADRAPQEIVVTNVEQAQTQQYFPTKPVVVLPITQKEEQEGIHKPLTEAFRWLVEWSQKITRMFVGKIIYRQEKD